MAAEMEFRGMFTVVPKQTLIPGDFYVGFECTACHLRFAVIEEPTQSGDVALSGTAGFIAECPSCGQDQERSASELLTFQAASAIPGQRSS